MRKLLHCFAFVAVLAAPGLFASQALADQILCPSKLTIDSVVKFHSDCRSSCQAEKKDKIDACRNSCDKIFMHCDDLRKEADKKQKK